MDNLISVLIVDDNVEFSDLLRQYINKSEGMRAVGAAKGGREGIELIKKLSPDVVILDIVMPNLDGIGVLENINKLELKDKPLFIILSAVGQDSYTRKAMDLGAEYYMVKPFDIEVLLTRVKEIYEEKNRNIIISPGIIASKKINYESGNRLQDIEIDVTMLLHEAGIPPHLSGYRYLREAIILTLKNPDSFSSVTKVLYPTIAEKFNSTPQKVERSIRNAIDSAWIKESEGLVNIFGKKAFINWDEKPTNSEFIAVTSEKIRIKRGSRLIK
jgi:two-component system response regulator (stage 0 sporulation protein A)